MNVILPKVAPSLLIVAGMVVFYATYTTQQDERYMVLGITLSVFLFLAGIILYYWNRNKYYHHLRYRV